jgi:hypothetical protein
MTDFGDIVIALQAAQSISHTKAIDPSAEVGDPGYPRNVYRRLVDP